MRILDKYTLRTFFVPWIYSTLGFAFLFIIVHLLDRLDTFTDAGVPFLDIVYFYGRYLTTIWINVGPITLLLGLLSALYQLTRNNEIIAMRASGISLYRILLPFLFLGFGFSLFTIHVHENIAPKNLEWTEQYIEELKRPDASILRNQRFRDPETNRTWDIGEMDLETHEIRGLNLIQRHPLTDTIQYVVQAKRAEWLDTHWAFYEATLQPHSELGYPMGNIETFPVRLMLDVTESPDRILRETMELDVMSTRQMKDYLANRPSISDKTRADLLTRVHQRSAQPWMCLVVVMLAVPFGTQTARKGVFAGVVMCFGLFFSFNFIMNLGKALGQGQRIDPWMAGWMPLILYGLLGIHLLRKLR